MADVKFQDDPSIPGDELLYRGVVLPFIVEGELSRAAFKHRPPNLNPSVDRSSLCSPQETWRRKSEYVGVVELPALAAREHANGVASNPLEDNPAHALILMEDFGTNKRDKVARKLAQACRWAIEPDLRDAER